LLFGLRYRHSGGATIINHGHGGKRLGQQEFGALIGFSYDYEGRASMTLTSAGQLVAGALPRALFRLHRHSRIQVLPHAYGVAGSTDYQLAKDRTLPARFSRLPQFWDAGLLLNDNSGLDLLNGAGGHHPSIIHSQPRYIIETGVGRKALLHTWFLGRFRILCSENDNGMAAVLWYSECIHYERSLHYDQLPRELPDTRWSQRATRRLQHVHLP